MAIKKAAKPLNAFGTDLTAPVRGPAPRMVGGAIGTALQTSQNQANSANDLRYGQGLGVLTGGYNTSAGAIEQAIAASAQNGTTAKKQIDLQLQNDLGHTEQDAINRGLGNTTIRNSLLNIDKRRANDANQSIDEQVANRLTSLKLAQANNANQGAGSISSFIAGRNDIAPDAGLYASLAQQAEANKASTTKAVSTTVSPEFRASMARGLSGSGAGSGISAGGSSGYSGTSGGGSSGGGGGASYQGGSIASAIGGGTSAPQVTAPTTGGSIVLMGNGGSVNYKPPTDQTTINTPNGVTNGVPASQPGSISISKSGTKPCVPFNPMFHSGMDPKNSMFCQ